MRANLILPTVLLLVSCTSTPDVELDGVAVSEVVRRIKCELAIALPDVSEEYNPGKEFHWLKYWTAKVDLDLQTTNTGAVAPNLNYFDPRTIATLPGVGPIARSFTLNIGGSLKTDAYRSDKLSFTVSVDELMQIKLDDSCMFARGHGLLGNLGLSEWILSSLAPVADGNLEVGFHPAPGKTAAIFGPFEKAKPATGQVGAAALTLKPVTDKIIEAEKKAEQAREAAALTRKEVQRKDVSLSKKLRRAYFYADQAASSIKRAEFLTEEAKAKLWNAKREGDYAHDPKDKDLAAIDERLKDLGLQIASIKSNANAAWDLLPKDAPLDSIVHSVKFTLTASANITPNWLLVNFRGPGLNPPLLNAQKLRVHELTVVLGAPLEAGGKALSDEQRRQLLNQQIDSKGVLLLREAQ